MKSSLRVRIVCTFLLSSVNPYQSQLTGLTPQCKLIAEQRDVACLGNNPAGLQRSRAKRTSTQIGK